MTDYPATWLASVLRAAGCRVIEESGWTTRGRPASTGTFAPRALVRHWDASPPGSHNVSTLINGNGSAPGPLCQIWTCDGNSSHPPSVHVIAAGRANHGGEGNGWGVIPRDDANTYAVGHEIRQTVNEAWPEDQLAQVRLAEKAILDYLDASTGNALCSHSEYAPDRKIDTTEGSHGQDMNHERDAVADATGGGEVELRNYFVAVSTSGVGDLGTDARLIKWSNESSDQGGAHDSGTGAIYALYPCTMTGTVEVQVTEGVVDVEVDRYGPDGYLARLAYAPVLPVGYHSLAFVGLFAEGDRCYLALKRSGDAGAVNTARMSLSQVERS